MLRSAFFGEHGIHFSCDRVRREGGTNSNAYLAALLVVTAYVTLLTVGCRTGLWKRFGVVLLGPVMMFRTKRGRGFIERVARPRRVWTTLGSLAVFITSASAAALTAFLVLQAADSAEEGAAFEVEPIAHGEPPARFAATALYVVVSFAAAIAIHELAHGVMAASAGIRLLHTGVLVFVIPVGAFVETDDEGLRNAPRRSRRRLYASGPASNLVMAGVFFLVLVGLVGPAARPLNPGAVVTDVALDSPAAVYGIEPWDEIVSVGGAPVLNNTQMRQASFAEPGEPVRVEMFRGSTRMTVYVPGGVVIHAVYEGPGHDAGLKPGMIVRSLNRTLIHTISEFRSATENASMHEPVEITVLSYYKSANGGKGGYLVNTSVATVNLTSKWLYYWTHYPWANREEYKGVSFMAVSVSPLGVWTEDLERLTSRVARPFDSGEDIMETFRDFVGLPLAGYSPVTNPVAELYGPGGVLGFMPSSLYWTVLNLLYWLFWANLMLGLTNALPALPFDGGYLVRDLLRGFAAWRERRVPGLDATIGRRLFTEERVDDIMLFVSGMLVFLVAYLLLEGNLRNALGA
ncbi:MAG: site-2 protease family protein [Thermoplasmata archaeon]